jgi:hypothetical protein
LQYIPGANHNPLKKEDFMILNRALKLLCLAILAFGSTKTVWAEDAGDWEMSAMLEHNPAMVKYVTKHFPDASAAPADVGYDNLCNVYGCPDYGPYSNRFWISYGSHRAGGDVSWDKETDQYTLKVEFTGEAEQPAPIHFWTGKYGYYEAKDAFLGLAADGEVSDKANYSACEEMMANNPREEKVNALYECEGQGSLDGAVRTFSPATDAQRSCLALTDYGLVQFGRSLDDRGWVDLSVLAFGKSSELPELLDGKVAQAALAYEYSRKPEGMNWSLKAESDCSWHMDILMDKTWECGSDTEVNALFSPETGKLTVTAVETPRSLLGHWSRKNSVLATRTCKLVRK